MKKALVDIPEDFIDQLDSLARKMEVSRAELIRQAIKSWLQVNREIDRNAFGILKKSSKKYEGLEFQRKMRSDW